MQKQPTARLHMLMSDALDALQDCISQRQDGDHALLVDAGVTVLADFGRAGALREAFGERISALQADVMALGLAPMAERRGIALTTDGEWARLVREHVQVLSWK